MCLRCLSIVMCVALAFLSSKAEAHLPQSIKQSKTKSKVKKIAYKYIGRPYKWGATGPRRFDCSGFVQFVFKKVGVKLPRTSKRQANTGRDVSAKEIFQIGDLLFFSDNKRGVISHVGIYVGYGNMIHASRTRGVIVDDLRSDYYRSRYKHARRILGPTARKRLRYITASSSSDTSLLAKTFH